MDYFDDRDKAAKWLYDKAHQLSVKYNAEVGARIFAIGDKFAVGTVVTDYHSNQVFVANSINVKPKGEFFVGSDSSWHSHAKDSVRYQYGNYSDNDLIRVKEYNYSYMSHTNLYPGVSSLYKINPTGLASLCVVGTTCK